MPVPPVRRARTLVRSGALGARLRRQEAFDRALEIVGSPAMSERQGNRHCLRVPSGRESPRIAEESHELLVDVQLLDQRAKQGRRPPRSSRLVGELSQRVPAALLTPVPH